MTSSVDRDTTNGEAAGAPRDGLVAVVKRDCPTCELIAPVLADIEARGSLTVYTQDDPSFPESVSIRHHDGDLSFSWHHDIETVPTLMRISGGTEVGRIVGWSRPEWQAFTELDALGDSLPEHRPGCGSLSVDPSMVDVLAARFGSDGLAARRVEFGSLEDAQEAMHDRGWSDGLPLVAPSAERVSAMLAGTSRRADEIVANVAPDLADCTVTKAAVNAVMAGCRPEYFPVVLAALTAVCNDTFNMHGMLATTMPVGPVFIVNGPIAREIGMNSGINVFGQGNRANSTIGRAVQLIVRNVGGDGPAKWIEPHSANPARWASASLRSKAPQMTAMAAPRAPVGAAGARCAPTSASSPAPTRSRHSLARRPARWWTSSHAIPSRWLARWRPR